MAVHTNPLITVITVVKNDQKGLLRTIQSVSSRKWPGLEYVVIDGGSSDGSLEIIRQHKACIDILISEQDSGVYDAMNKGIVRSSGDYLLFLNSGDELVDDLDSLSPILAEGYSMVYGKANMLHEDGTLSYVKGKQLKNIGKLIRGTPLCHQAILYKRDFIGLYDTDYKIIADRVLTYELIKQYGLARTCFIDRTIANYYEGGFSRKHEELWKMEELAFLKTVGKHGYSAYKWLGWHFKKLKGALR
ncbi:MAG: glycosyltransferase family 2 protein [Desulfuromonadaceae bacterium]|nr:glycosyltransferase family 2 protein [Desulfuromonadaceae bacterium]